MERRSFLKASCQLCLLGAAGYLVSGLASCNASRASVYKAEISNKQVKIPLSLFAAGDLQMVRPRGWFYDIAVQKHTDDSYSALLMKCTHMDNQLTTSGSGYQCSLHGSQFDKEGIVRKGPAEHPLQRFKTTIEDHFITIYI